MSRALRLLLVVLIVATGVLGTLQLSQADGQQLERCGTPGTPFFRVCPPGQTCCNASCGICTPEGVGCVQIACEFNPPGQS
jgi:hypothetical protein